VVLAFESVDEILWCDHSSKTSFAVLHVVLFILKYLTTRNLECVLNLILGTLKSKRVNQVSLSTNSSFQKPFLL